MPTTSDNAHLSTQDDDLLVLHCPHARCRRARRCRWVGKPGPKCLAIGPLRRYLVDRLMARLKRAIR